MGFSGSLELRRGSQPLARVDQLEHAEPVGAGAAEHVFWIGSVSEQFAAAGRPRGEDESHAGSFPADAITSTKTERASGRSRAPAQVVQAVLLMYWRSPSRTRSLSVSR